MALDIEAAIVQTMREVILGLAGNVRVIAANTFGEEAREGQGEEDLFALAKVRPRFAIQLPPLPRTGIIAHQGANIAVLEALPVVTLTHAALHEVNTQGRYDLVGLAASQARAIRNALTWASNMAATLAGDPTYLISSVLVELKAPTVPREDWSGRLYQTQLFFRGLVKETRAVS